MVFRVTSSEELFKRSPSEIGEHLARNITLTNQEYALQTKYDLLVLRDTYSDVIPTTIVHSNTKYKCRVGWFQSIFAKTSTLVRRKMVSSELVEKINSFQTTMSVMGDRLTTEKDISWGNSLLTDLIVYLELNYQLPYSQGIKVL